MRAAALVLVLLLAGCTTPAPPPAPPGPTLPPAPPPPPPPTPPPVLDVAALASQARAFDGARALEQVQWQLVEPCLLPPCPPRYRITGSPGNEATARGIAAQLQERGFAVRWDNFTSAFEGAPLPAHNVEGLRSGAGNRTLFLGAHYDTRPCADKDPDPLKRREPVLGANDGASGVAVLLALAELLQGRAPNLTLRLVFFDAEDMGDAGLGCGRGTAWAQGSAHFAGNLSEADVRGARMVLLDMVGDKDLELRREGYSAQPPHRTLQDEAWAWATRLGHAQFANATSVPITDDHLPFQRRGIPSLDIIHLDAGPDVFPASHHTTFDDLAHLSPASLEAVGETVLAAVLAWDAEAGPRT